ncbi:plasmid partitioning protein RepB [Rhizobium leucaenae]|uniref:ParB family chromosome partitioning protein n=1 Tax=Rhizobium leucaenae TaxID=29450 RepID=A0A7W6ZY33_9HYPH|nr:plasmid partitioning protein RepB [Rhizobium leucaenae]MBB4570821.1 ParB family chromosome partitioning protein [Rhizobium leucaenae]MBB6303637.1 ParB family chromosome partitioning protein [Rhizobium leucaenae]
MSRKDSKGMFANVLVGLADEVSTPSPATSPSPHLLKVAAGVRQLQERGELADKLLRNADHIIELDVDAVLPSQIRDRFDGAYEAERLQDLVESMREHGQTTPGLVRPVGGEGGKFQIVFGRRRLAAAKLLGVKFRAIVRDLSDEQAIVIQGEENANRDDLSFIEKCVFALSQEEAGFKREVICASLATGKSHVSEMLQIARSFPKVVLAGIGAAPETGRRRWAQLAERWSANADAAGIAERILAEPGLQPLSSDNRFAAVLNAVSPVKKASASASAADRVQEVVSKGLTLAVVNYAKAGTRLTFTKAVPDDFVKYLLHRIEGLHEEYLGESQKAQNQSKRETR